MLIGEMICNYCRLVRTHAGRRYSAVVQKALIYIDANISGELNLRALAAMLEVTLGYLSTIFHRETDQTLTEYVTQQRMKVAFQLLQTTHLQVQTIAQICGMQDANYFTKVFKRCYHITPPSGCAGSSNITPVWRKHRPGSHEHQPCRIHPVFIDKNVFYTCKIRHDVI